ncbi:MAG: DNA/RNA non-specific endonuclease [Collinsella sp.]
MKLESPKPETKAPNTVNRLKNMADRLIGYESKEQKHAPNETKNVIPINPNKLIEPANKEYRDDNGKLFRKGNELIPNNKYVENGYSYRTDSEGRVKSAEGQLQLSKESRKQISDSMETIGKGDQKEGDQKGHLIGDRFGGGNGLENIVAMDGRVNQSDYKRIENTCAEALESGHEVYLKVVPKYDKTSNRPTSFRITYTIDGEKTVTTIKNGASK